MTEIPIAEHFHSIMGEGQWVGTPMHFIRLPGCSVGARATESRLVLAKTPGDMFVIPQNAQGVRASMCRTYDGRFFTCDTDFNAHERVSVEALIAETHESHICLTGGEPLNHASKSYFDELFQQAHFADKIIHIETSGTIDWFRDFSDIWIACAPKFGFIPSFIERADEVKILVDADFSFAQLHESIRNHKNVFVSPINGEHEVNQANVALCLEILKSRPSWRLSAQWHKFLHLR